MRDGGELQSRRKQLKRKQLKREIILRMLNNQARLEQLRNKNRTAAKVTPVQTLVFNSDIQAAL